MNRLLLSIPIALCSYLSFGQSALQSEGDLPYDFTPRFTEDFIERAHDGVSGSRQDKEKEELMLRAEFALHEMIVSGDVLFGDPITNYLEEITDKLLSDDSRLRDEIQVYTLKSNVPNAFMTSNGRLFVTTALIAQVQNESEIAYIMAHEIAHHVHEDIARGFEKGYEDEYDKDMNTAARRLSKFEYSREMELEADEYAFELLVESGAYNPENAVDIFDVMLYAYLPFDELAFDHKWLLPNDVEFPPFIINKIEDGGDITAEKDADDTHSTHPNIEKRQDQFVDAVLEMEDAPKGLDKNPLGEDRFNEIQRLARIDAVKQDLRYANYVRVVYNAFTMAKRDTSLTEFATQATATALQAMASYKNDDEYNDLTRRSDYNEGSIFEVYTILEELDDDDATALALAYTYRAHLQYPENKSIEMAYDNMIHQVVRFHEKELKDFTAAIVADTASVDTLSEEEYAQLSKIEKIRYDRSLEGSYGSWVGSILTEHSADEKLAEDFKAALEEYEDDMGDRDGMTEEVYREYLDESSSDDDEYEDKHLNLREVIYIAPEMYYIRPADGDEAFKMDKTLEYREEMDKAAQSAMRSAGLRPTVLSPNEFRSGSIEEYNDYATLKAWYEERLNHVNTPAEVSSQNEAIAIADRLEVDYLVVPLVLHSDVPAITAPQVVYSVVLFPLLPFTILDGFTSDDKTFIVCYVMNIRTGSVVLANFRSYEGRLYSDYTKQMFYDMFYQIAN